jgi:hypothetical protein
MFCRLLSLLRRHYEIGTFSATFHWQSDNLYGALNKGWLKAFRNTAVPRVYGLSIYGFIASHTLVCYVVLIAQACDIFGRRVLSGSRPQLVVDNNGKLALVNAIFSELVLLL